MDVDFITAWTDDPVMALMILAIVLAIVFLRIVRDDERVTTLLLGRYLLYRGPGFVVWLPLLYQSWRRHRIGDSGTLRNTNKALFKGVLVDVVVEGGSQIGDRVVLKRFQGYQFIVGPSR